MGSEGYLINQFIARRTNHRRDEWGGSYENRIKFPIEIVQRTRKAVGKDFIIIYRLSMLVSDYYDYDYDNDYDYDFDNDEISSSIYVL